MSAAGQLGSWPAGARPHRPLRGLHLPGGEAEASAASQFRFADLRVPGATLLLVSAALLVRAFGLDAIFELDRARLLVEPWRILTGQLAHFGGSHLFWDAATLALVGAVAERRWPRRTLLAIAGTLIAVPAAVVLLEPGTTSFRGLSAVATAVVVLLAIRGAVESFRERARFRGAVHVALLVLFAAKVGVEARLGTPLFAEVPGDFHPDPIAHLVGALAGAAAGLAPRFRLPRAASAIPLASVVVLGAVSPGCATVKLNQLVSHARGAASVLPKGGEIRAEYVGLVEEDGRSFWVYRLESPFRPGRTLDLFLSTTSNQPEAQLRSGSARGITGSPATIRTGSKKRAIASDAGVFDPEGRWRPDVVHWTGEATSLTDCISRFSWFPSEDSARIDAWVRIPKEQGCPRPIGTAWYALPLYTVSVPFDVATSPLWFPMWLATDRKKCPFSYHLVDR